MSMGNMPFNRLWPRFKGERNTVHLVSVSCNTVPPEKYGGIELIVANLAHGFVKCGLTVRVYSPGKLTISGCEHSQTLIEPTTGFQQGAVANTAEHLSRVKAELLEHCRLGDVIIFNHADHYRYLKKRLGRVFFAKVRAFEIAHWMDVGLQKNIIYPSNGLKSLLKKPGVVIPHGEDLLFAQEEQSKHRNLFYAGRITIDKGLDQAVAACEKLGCKLRIAGPPADTPFFDKIVNDKNVEFLGELCYADLFREYQSARAFIYMTQYEEPFGLAVIEAMAAGCPVITSGKGGTGETVVHMKTGIICRTVEDILDAYHRVDELAFSDIVDRARTYTVEAMVSKYNDLLTQT